MNIFGYIISLFPFHITCIQFSKYISIKPLLYLVGPSGLEPPTSRLSGVRSNHLSYEPIFCGSVGSYPQNPFYSGISAFGGDKRDRTADPLLAKQVLSQLSYTPIFPFRKSKTFKIKQRLLRLSDSDLTSKILFQTFVSP